MTYTFRVSLQQEEDGRWSAWIDSLPGCATWGYTREDALQSLEDAAYLIVEDMVECGQEVPVEAIETLQVVIG